MTGNATALAARLTTALLAVAAGWLLVACGEAPVQPLTLNPAPAAPGEPIDLDLPRDPSGAFAFDRWPRACDLLTDGEIKAVLPQIRKLRREADDQQITINQPIIGGTPGVAPRDVTAVGVRCTVMLDLPDAGLKLDSGSFSNLLMTVEAAGSRGFVKQNFLVDRDHPIRTSKGRCYVQRSAAGVACIVGRLAFSISSSFSYHDIDTTGDRRWTDRYEVGGRITKFSGLTGGSGPVPKESQRTMQFRRDHLDIELAKIVLRKL